MERRPHEYQDKQAKIEAYYGPIHSMIYPLIYACLADMDAPLPQASEGLRNYLRYGKFEPDWHYDESLVIEGLHKKFPQTIPVTYHDRYFQTQIQVEGLNIDFFHATSEQNNKLNASLMHTIARLSYHVFNPDSYTSQVLAALKKYQPKAHKLVLRAHPLRSTLEGIFSVGQAGIVLNHNKILHGNLEAEDQMSVILESGIITDFTRRARAGALAGMGFVDIVPRDELLYNDDELQLTDDMKTYIEVMNQVSGFSYIPHPMGCPFAIPLGEKGAEAALAFYGNELPERITEELLSNYSINGITTTAKKLRDLLFE